MKDGLEKNQIYDFFLKQADLDLTKEELTQAEQRIRLLEHQSKEEEEQLQAVAQDRA